MCSKHILGFGKPAVNLVQERNSEPFGILGLEENTDCKKQSVYSKEACVHVFQQQNILSPNFCSPATRLNPRISDVAKGPSQPQYLRNRIHHHPWTQTQ